jgi:hypothetical protein
MRVFTCLHMCTSVCVCIYMSVHSYIRSLTDAGEIESIVCVDSGDVEVQLKLSTNYRGVRTSILEHLKSLKQGVWCMYTCSVYV